MTAKCPQNNWISGLFCMQTTGKRMGQIVRFEMDEPETAGVQTQQPPPVSSPISLTDEEEKMSRDSNAEIRHKSHQALECLMDGNARFAKVRHDFPPHA